MANITINPEDTADIKTPLYGLCNKDGATIYRLLPETSADQVKMANGENIEIKIANINADLNFASNAANTAIANAANAQNEANSAKTTANNAIAIANLAKDAATVMQGASDTVNGKQGLVPMPEKGAATRFLRSDGAWATPPNTTYSTATTENAGLMSAADKAIINKPLNMDSLAIQLEKVELTPIRL